jgi:hypothetical protein
MMNKERLPHIITAVSFVVFIVLGLACATNPSVPRDKQKQIKELAKSRYPSETNWDPIRRPPYKGETVLGTYEDSLSFGAHRTISAAEEQAYINKTARIDYKRPSFYPHEVVAALMIKACAEFPDIDIEDLDVRSYEQVGDIHVSTFVNPAPIPQFIRTNPPEPPTYSFQATETLSFKGVVVNTRVVILPSNENTTVSDSISDDTADND